ncbi:MAG TPA: hypothetical protein VI874_04910 [Candidatus Norongarragalinales archaeon]|nr:hypothetical protein [Candidatus Norongarragalinales archaeon]
MEQVVRYSCTLRKLLKDDDFHGLKELSKDAAKDAFIYQNSALVDASVVAYSISKMAQKSSLYLTPSWKAFRKKALEKLKIACDEQEPSVTIMHDLLEEVYRLSAQFGRFAQNIVEKARLRAAAQMYAHGASLLKAAEFSGCPVQEASSYIGATRIPEKYKTMAVDARLRRLRELFA